MPRPPPSSTLFPYTTLFRSKPGDKEEQRDGADQQEQLERWLGGDQPGGAQSNSRVTLAACRESDSELDCAPPGWSPPRDRKSTRLNSSHEWISYAVFCLKKK